MSPFYHVLIQTPAMIAGLLFLYLSFLRLGRAGSVWNLCGALLLLGNLIFMPIYWYVLAGYVWEHLGEESIIHWIMEPVGNLWLALAILLITIGFWPRRPR